VGRWNQTGGKDRLSYRNNRGFRRIDRDRRRKKEGKRKVAIAKERVAKRINKAMLMWKKRTKRKTRRNKLRSMIIYDLGDKKKQRHRRRARQGMIGGVPKKENNNSGRGTPKREEKTPFASITSKGKTDAIRIRPRGKAPINVEVGI